MDRAGLKYVNQTILFAKIGLVAWTLLMVTYGVLRIATGGPPFDPGLVKFAAVGWAVSAILLASCYVLRSLYGDKD